MKNLKKVLCLVLSLLLLLSVLTACGGSAGDKADTAPAADGDTAPAADGDASAPAGEGGEDAAVPEDGVSLSMVMAAGLDNVDPAFNYSMDSMQNISLTDQGLMTFDEEGKVTCGLAESYDISPDGKTYTFHIRDAKWSNGDPVTANDFYYSWTRLTNPATGSAYAYMLYTLGVVNALDCALGTKPIEELGISAPDDKTFVVELDGARPYFLYLTAMASYFMAVNQKYLESDPENFGMDINHYIACGPFIISDWEVGASSVTLVKNPDYYDADKVTCDELTFTVVTDTSAVVMGWDKGEYDYIGLTGDYVEMYRDDPALTINDMAAMYFLSFNTGDQYMANKNLRLALSLSIDKQSIVDNLLNNGSLVADYIIPDTFAVDDSGVDYRDRIGNPTYNSCDKAAAADYFTKALGELGVDSLQLTMVYDTSTITDTMAAFLKSEWEGALPGLTVELKQTTYNSRLEDMGNHDYQIGFTRWYADYQDALTYLDMWISTSQMNYGQYNNPAYDELYYKVTGELAMDPAGREAAMKEMEAMILGDAAICPIYQLAACALANPEYNWVKNVAGVVQYQFVSRK